jgi:hypothetical protein
MSASTRLAPSSIEYSVWTCRWTNESPTLLQHLPEDLPERP